MKFISRGDFIFPFDAHFYWLKQVYMWSYQSGSANPDGIIRMPGRLLDMAVFALLGNLAVSIFFLLSSLAAIFIAFYYYTKLFLKIDSKLLSFIAALVFTVNPIFLGNISKIGLIVAVGMLPLALVAIQKTFERHDLRFLLLWVVSLNISLIHPYTFVVNSLLSTIYFIYRASFERRYVLGNIPKLLLLGLVAMCLNAYLLFPIASLGSVSKDVITSNVSSTPTDYTSLIGIANTGDVFTGLGLFKNVFKDYEFFSPRYQLFYYLGVFGFYLLLFGVYVGVEKRMSNRDRKLFIAALAAFLVFILLATVNMFRVKDLIAVVIGLPGGWIFRSPLKWQLYLPITVASMLVVGLKYVTNKRARLIVFSSLAVVFVLMNGFIGADVYRKLLSPRSITNFMALQALDLNQKNMLVVNDERCFPFASTHYDVMTELNQVLISKNVQVKQTSLSDANALNLSQYDYVLGCQNIARELIGHYDFARINTFVGNSFQLYENKKLPAYVSASQSIYGLTAGQDVGEKYDVVHHALKTDFNFVGKTSTTSSTSSIQNPFEQLNFTNIKNGRISADVILPQPTSKQLMYIKADKSVYTKINADELLLSPTPLPGYGQQPANQPLDTKLSGLTKVSYIDPTYHYDNIFPNGSLEQGLWQKNVGDCYAYGDKRDIHMSLTSADKTDGKQALELAASSHVACTGPNNIPVETGQKYLLSFDYKSMNGKSAAYYISFNDPTGTTYFERLPDTKGQWQTFVKDIVVPFKAKRIKVLVYTYPDTSGVLAGVNIYDNFKLTKIPDVLHKFYVISQAKQMLTNPENITYNVINPTKTIIHVSGARSSFYLETKESYSPKWQLSAYQQAATTQHLRMNNTMNGWLVTPNQPCGPGCHQNSDGSYDITLVMEFAPQRWFYLGLIVSSASLLGTVVYLLVSSRRSRRYTTASTYGARSRTVRSRRSERRRR